MNAVKVESLALTAFHGFLCIIIKPIMRNYVKRVTRNYIQFLVHLKFINNI